LVEEALSSIEAIQMVATPVLQVEIPTMAAVASSPILSVGEVGLQANLDIAVGEDDSCLDPKASRILPELVAAMWEVHWL
jgi:hypothetical protein